MHISTVRNLNCFLDDIFEENDFLYITRNLIERVIAKGLKAANIVYLCYGAKSDNFF